AATARCRTPASAWASSAASPGCVASTTCARRSPSRACSSGSGRETLTARNPVSMRAAARRTPLLALCLLALVAGVAGAQEGEPETPRPRRTRPAAAPHPAPTSPHDAETRALLHQLADAQRSLGEQVQQLKDVLEALRTEVASQKDEATATEQEVKALRDEVKGLYVESSGVKQQIDALKDDIGGVNSNVSGFRTYSGFFIAVMILLLAVIFVLTIRRW